MTDAVSLVRRRRRRRADASGRPRARAPAPRPTSRPPSRRAAKGTVDVQRDRTQLALRVRALPELVLIAEYGYENRSGEYPLGARLRVPGLQHEPGQTLEVSPGPSTTTRRPRARAWSGAATSCRRTSPTTARSTQPRRVAHARAALRAARAGADHGRTPRARARQRLAQLPRRRRREPAAALADDGRGLVVAQHAGPGPAAADDLGRDDRHDRPRELEHDLGALQLERTRARRPDAARLRSAPEPVASAAPARRDPLPGPRHAHRLRGVQPEHWRVRLHRRGRRVRREPRSRLRSARTSRPCPAATGAIATSRSARRRRRSTAEPRSCCRCAARSTSRTSTSTSTATSASATRRRSRA